MARAFVSALSLVVVLNPLAARAQSDDAIGVRAQGMGGAFTAVADDATATWWNPAGLAGGAYLNALIEVGRVAEPSTERDASGAPRPAWRAGARGFAVAFPALGLSYYRLRVSEIRPPTSIAAADPVRQDQGTADVYLRSLDLQQFGLTVGQSIGEHLVVGSTLKLARGSVGVTTSTRAAASLDEADALNGALETHAGLDLGAMLTFGRARAGIMVRNLKEMEFGSGVDAVVLERHIRAGAALTTGSRGAIGTATVAVDADLTRTTTVAGDERKVAVGAEAWTTNRVLGVRGGLSANTVGERRTSFSGGLSARFRSRMYVDAQRTGGSDEVRHGWGLDLRVTF
jgi:F plasmid transfer operon, TraF, protein